MKNALTTSAVVALCALAGAAGAQAVDVTGGQTSVLLDTATLSSAASLDLSGTSPDVLSGAIDGGSVAFGINPRDAASLPTSFSYDSADFLGTFSGTIEHTGSVFFNNDTVEVGNFTIGYDANRVGDARTGFFVESTTGIAAILFDIGNISQLEPTPSSLTIGADLLVSAEFGQFLFDNQLSASNLTGADVGDALVQAVPTPGTVAAIGLAGLVASRRRR